MTTFSGSPIVRSAAAAVMLAALLAIGPQRAALAQPATAKPAPAAKAGAAKPAPGSPADDAHRRQDVAQHRQIASAHETAAKCLEQGRPEEDCHRELRQACQGIAIGKYCGMRHRH